jgi:DNA-binding transcriptional MocR family regulator
MNELVKALVIKGCGDAGGYILSGFSIDGNYIRLNFSYPSEKDIKEGISILNNCN